MQGTGGYAQHRRTRKASADVHDTGGRVRHRGTGTRTARTAPVDTHSIRDRAGGRACQPDLKETQTPYPTDWLSRLQLPLGTACFSASPPLLAPDAPSGPSPPSLRRPRQGRTGLGPARPRPPVCRCLARTPVLVNSGSGARPIAAHKARTRHTQCARRARALPSVSTRLTRRVRAPTTHD